MRTDHKIDGVHVLGARSPACANVAGLLLKGEKELLELLLPVINGALDRDNDTVSDSVGRRSIRAHFECGFEIRGKEGKLKVLVVILG